MGQKTITMTKTMTIRGPRNVFVVVLVPNVENVRNEYMEDTKRIRNNQI